MEGSTKGGGGISGDAQHTANRLVDEAQNLANQVVDLGEEGLSVALGAIGTAIKVLGETVERLQERVSG